MAAPGAGAAGRSAFGSPLVIGAVLAGVTAIVVAGLVLVGGRTGSAASATEMAEFVPADTHLLVAMNTDLASGPWLALPDLLEAMGVEDRAREELEQSFAEEDVDYATEIEPLLSVANGVALTMQLNAGAFDSAMLGTDPLEFMEFVAIIHARDAEQALDLIDQQLLADDPEATRSERRDEAYGLDVIEYTAGEETSVLARRDDLIYLATRLEDITSLLDRAEQAGTLSAHEPFARMAGELRHEPLLFFYGDGAVLEDALASAESAELFGDLDANLEADPGAYSMTASLTATGEGFTGEVLVFGEDGLGALAGSELGEADLALAAEAVPGDALAFIAAPGLREGLEKALAALESEAAGMEMAGFGEDLLAEFELQTGVDLEQDLIQHLDGTFVLAGGLTDVEQLDGFALFATEADDPAAVEQALRDLVDWAAMLCFCDPDIGVGQAGGFVRLAWPAAQLDPPAAGASVADEAAYQQTLDLLPADPASIIFFNIEALPAAALEEVRDAAGAEFTVDAVLGAAAASQQDAELAHVSFVIPILNE